METMVVVRGSKELRKIKLVDDEKIFIGGKATKRILKNLELDPAISSGDVELLEILKKLKEERG